MLIPNNVINIKATSETGIRGQVHKTAIKDLAETAERSSHSLCSDNKDVAWAAKISS